MADTVLRQHRFELFVGHFVPQRFAFDFVGINVARTRDVAQQIQLRRAPGGLNHFPVARRFSRYVFTLLQVVQPLRVHQLFEVRQTLQAGWVRKRIAEGGDMVKAHFLQAGFDSLYVVIAAIQCHRRVSVELM